MNIKVKGALITITYIAIIIVAVRLAIYTDRSATVLVIDESESVDLIDGIFSVNIQRFHNTSLQSHFEHSSRFTPRFGETKKFEIELKSNSDGYIVRTLPSHKSYNFHAFTSLETTHNIANSNIECKLPSCKSKVVSVNTENILVATGIESNSELLTINRKSKKITCRLSEDELRNSIASQGGLAFNNDDEPLKLNKFFLTKKRSYIYQAPKKLSSGKQIFFEVIGCNQKIRFFALSDRNILKNAILLDVDLVNSGYVLVLLKSRNQRAIFNTSSNQLQLLDSNRFSTWVSDPVKPSFLFYKLNNKSELELLQFDLSSKSITSRTVDVSFEFESLNYKIRESLPIIF
jgi:hypothetical protein